MALTQDQINQAQGWGNQQWGGGRDASGVYHPGAVNWGNYDPNANPNENWGLLGAGQAAGYSPSDISQVFGGKFTPDQIAGYETQYKPQIDAYAGSFKALNGGNYDPNSAPGMSAGGGNTGSMTSQPGGFGGGYMGGPSLDTNYHANPYLDQIAGGITSQYNNNLQRNILPGISNGAAAVGGVGGSREGIAQGLAIGDSNRGLASALSGMYGNDYEQSMARNLQKYGMDQSYGLGQGNLALGNKNADYNYNLGLGGQGLNYQGLMQNFYTQQRGQDLQQQQLGASLYGLGSQGDFSGLNDANGLYNNYTGYGSDQTSSQGGGGLGMFGGALAGYQLYNGLGGNNSNLGGPISIPGSSSNGVFYG